MTQTAKPIATFKQVVRDDIKQRWKLDNIDVSTCMVLSAVMDLRFKPLMFLDDEKLELMKRISHLPNQISIEETSPSAKKSKTAMDILFGKEEEHTPNPSDPLDEVLSFLAEKHISRNSSLLN